MFTLIQPDDVRMMVRNQPNNLKLLVYQALAQLMQVVESPVEKYYPQALTCVRVLTRVLPFVLECTASASEGRYTFNGIYY